MPPPLPRPVQRDIPRPSPSRPPMIPRPRPAPQPRAFEASMQQPYQRIESRNDQYRDTTGYFGHAPSHSNETMSLTSPASSQNISAAFRQCSVPQSDTLPFGHAPDPRQERGHHDTVSLAQLSLHSAGLGDQRTHYSIENSRSIEHGFNAAPSALHADPQYQGPQGAATQYNHEFLGGLPIRLFHSSYESPHIVSSQRQNFAATHAPYEVVQNQSNYADSPFFKHNGSVSRPDTMQRPPARGNNPQHQFRTFVDNYRIPTASTLDSQRLHGVGDSSRAYGSQAYESAYVSPQRKQRPSIHHQQHTAAPQTPRNSQGFFRRPDRPPPPPVFRSPSKPNRGGRITLPPSAGTAPFNMDQDSVVSQIRGVRGVSSYRNPPFYQTSASNYGSARPLFSASGRQSNRW